MKLYYIYRTRLPRKENKRQKSIHSLKYYWHKKKTVITTIVSHLFRSEIDVDAAVEEQFDDFGIVVWLGRVYFRLVYVSRVV